MTYSSLNLSLLLPGKPVPIKPVGLPVSVRVGHFKARPDPEARSLEVALPVQGSWRVGLGSGSGFGSGLTSLHQSIATIWGSPRSFYHHVGGSASMIPRSGAAAADWWIWPIRSAFRSFDNGRNIRYLTRVVPRNSQLFLD